MRILAITASRYNMTAAKSTSHTRGSLAVILRQISLAFCRCLTKKLWGFDSFDPFLLSGTLPSAVRTSSAVQGWTEQLSMTLL